MYYTKNQWNDWKKQDLQKSKNLFLYISINADADVARLSRWLCGHLSGRRLNQLLLVHWRIDTSQLDQVGDVTSNHNSHQRALEQANENVTPVVLVVGDAAHAGVKGEED